MQQIFVHDRDADKDGIFDEVGATATLTSLVSVASSGVQANAPSARPSISNDGRFVVFESTAGNLAPGNTQGRTHIYLRDRDTDGNGAFDEPGAGQTTTSRISNAQPPAPANTPANADSIEPHLSADGRFIAFASSASDLAPGGSNFFQDIFVRDRVTGQTRVVSTSFFGGAPDLSSHQPALSANGRFVVFASRATNLAEPTDGTLHIFLRDRDPDGNGTFDEAGAVTFLVSITSSGSQGNFDSFSPRVSVDGRVVVFSSFATNLSTNLVGGDTNNVSDVFLAGGLARCPDGSEADDDGDGLLNCWEDGSLWSDGLPGIRFNGTWTGNPADRDLTLCVDANRNGTFGAPGSMERAVECARRDRRDLFLEIDFMALHQPNQNAINDVVAKFALAPATSTAAAGIRLHVQVDEQAVAHNNNFTFVPCAGPAQAGIPDFDTVKRASFGTAAERAHVNARNILAAKRLAFRYGLFVHSLLGLRTTSGCAELPGNDFVVSLGGWTTVRGHDVGNQNEQAGTLMHELGHTLNLRHGGGDDINCKPNYLSVMSYTRQISDSTIPGDTLDYSRDALRSLREFGIPPSSAL